MEKKTLKVISRVTIQVFANLMTAFLFIWTCISSLFAIVYLPDKYAPGAMTISLICILLSAALHCKVSMGEEPYDEFLRDSLLTDRYLRYKQKWEKGEE